MHRSAILHRPGQPVENALVVLLRVRPLMTFDANNVGWVIQGHAGLVEEFLELWRPGAIVAGILRPLVGGDVVVMALLWTAAEIR